MQKAILLRELSNMLYLKEHSMCYKYNYCIQIKLEKLYIIWHHIGNDLSIRHVDCDMLA